MNAKEYLQQLNRLNTVINQKIKEVEDLRLKARSISGIDYSKDKVQICPSGDAPFVNMTNHIVDLEAEIHREIDEFVNEKHKIINQIQRLRDSDEINVLHKRYVEFLTFEKIADDMHYSIRNIHYIHGRGLKNFEELFLK